VWVLRDSAREESDLVQIVAKSLCTRFTELVISEERRVISNIISVLHRENGGVQKEAFFDPVPGEEGPMFSKLVSPEHDPQAVAMQQDTHKRPDSN
jgi:hypothetical protein